ncbi:MAG: amidohydrolase family protein [Firmicutes bacterium]|nr:amidohydrolase family protein [Bacillota bacterium]
MICFLIFKSLVLIIKYKTIMIFDIHTHSFLDKLAAHALESLSVKSEGIVPCSDGTLQGTISKMDEAGISGFAVLNISVGPRQQRNVNDFAVKINNFNDRVIAFGSVHPFSSDAIDELDRLKKSGIKGVKFHNEYQNFEIDDEKAYPVYEHCFKNGFVVLFHGGIDIGFSNPLRASPVKARNVAKTFKDYKFIMAHFGGYGCCPDVLKYLADCSNVLVDTSFFRGLSTMEVAQEIIDGFTSKRVLFGSDCPWADPVESVKKINALNLTAREKQDIFFNNAKCLLNL